MDRWDHLLVDKETGRPHLLPGEAELIMSPKVAIYVGETPMEEYREGNLTLTNHRLLWRPPLMPFDRAISLSLSLVERWESKSGFLTSSPKIILHLLPKSSQTPLHGSSQPPKAGSDENRIWKCYICDTENPPQEALKCSICGVPRKKDDVPTLARPSSHWSCSICTFSNANAAATVCEMCGTPRKKITNVAATTTGPADVVIKLSFRGGGSLSSLENNLQLALNRGDWKNPLASLSSSPEARAFDPTVAGITGLMKQVDLQQQTASETLSTAFDDLNSLMEKAAEMIKLAETIMNKVNRPNNTSAAEDTLNSSEEKEFQRMIVEMGLTSAVTREMTGGKDRVFIEELARQLAEFCLQLFRRRHTPLISVAELYCVYNRARGTNLVSPQEIVDAIRQFQPLDLPVRLMTLESGVIVVQPAGTQSQILTHIQSSLPSYEESLDAIQLAQQEHIPLRIAAMSLQQAERDGLICRDETPFGIIRYYRNLFSTLIQTSSSML